MRNIRIVIEYDGTCYSGWQIQKGQRTIQGEIAGAIRKVTGERVTIYGSGRTDSGVHAEGQAANFHTKSKISAERIPHALNAHLSDDIVIKSAEDVAADFHSRFHVLSKTYRYVIWQSPVPSALKRNFSHHLKSPLNIEAMRDGARALMGSNDYRAFCGKARSKENTVRTIFSIRIDKSGNLVTITVNGNGFLYNMVRAIAGTLVEVGLAKIPPERVAEIVKSKDRRKAGPTLPARGLTLVYVEYSNPT